MARQSMSMSVSAMSESYLCPAMSAQQWMLKIRRSDDPAVELAAVCLGRKDLVENPPPERRALRLWGSHSVFAFGVPHQRTVSRQALRGWRSERMLTGAVPRMGCKGCLVSGARDSAS